MDQQDMRAMLGNIAFHIHQAAEAARRLPDLGERGWSMGISCCASSAWADSLERMAVDVRDAHGTHGACARIIEWAHEFADKLEDFGDKRSEHAFQTGAGFPIEHFEQAWRWARETALREYPPMAENPPRTTIHP